MFPRSKADRSRAAAIRLLTGTLLPILLAGSVSGSAGCETDGVTSPVEDEPAPDPGSSPPGLVVSVGMPVAPDRHTAADTEEYAAALREIRTAIPAATSVHLFVDGDTSGASDWAAILDATADEGFQAAIGFAVRVEGRYQGYRPVRTEAGWDLGPLGELFACAECVGHPAFHSVLVIDEPWHHDKRPFYLPEDLADLYATLKALAPEGTDPPIALQFSRELWRFLVDDPRPGLAWGPGMADIVQISALEFQDGAYQDELLDGNHEWSRRIVAQATPGMPIWSSVQVFGGRYGPSAGYWFPRQRDGHADLTTLLEDIVDPKYQSIAPLEGIMLQKWDSEEGVREFQYTLGDVVFSGQPADQVAAAREALAALNTWLGIPATGS